MTDSQLSCSAARHTAISAIVCSLAILSHAAPPPLPVATPADAGMDADHLERIDGLVAQAIDAGQLPGCVVLITRQGRQVFLRAYGHRQTEPQREPMTVDTLFDLASVTKPVATATSVMLLVERGQLRLHEQYGAYAPEFNQNGKQDVTVFQMLTHQAGFVPDNPLGDYEDTEQIWPNLWGLSLSNPPGTRFVYSDVGYQMLGHLVERLSGQTLDGFARANLFVPLGMSETGFLPGDELRQRAATTERREGRWMRGEVHDPRAYAMGGIAGHAGLFSTAIDLARYAQMLLGEGQYGGVRVLSRQTVRQMVQPHPVAGQQRALGWDVSSSYSTNRGDLLGPGAFGHGGFTGTALWVDPQLQLGLIFLSNRVHPDGKGSVNDLIGRINSVAAAAVERGAPSPAAEDDPIAQHSSDEAAPVLPGIDVLSQDKFASLAGRRVGLITNHTGRDRRGRRTIDLLQEAEEVELVAIFSPEHGIYGSRDDNQIADDRDASTGVPIYSLYGPRRSPDPSLLGDIDTLVFDIQDIGTRFYTYISTMGNAMRVAAEQGKRFVVLDRPNPLGGTVVAGPVLDDGRQSFVGFHTLPIQHGMTVGELARMFRDELEWPLELEVVEVAGWRRDMLWDETGLVWIDPSPNMRSWNQALFYPGIGLLETANLSVGRGTDRPFELLGAPWIEASHLAERLNRAGLPGLRFVPREFTPTSSKFAGEKCGGVELLIVDRSQVAAVRTGITIASVLHQLYPQAWQQVKMDRLLCDAAVLEALQTGRCVPAIESVYQGELAEFLRRRERYLIYE